MQMCKMECVIRPSKLDEVKRALFALGIDGITVSEVAGIGAHRGAMNQYRGTAYEADLKHEVKLEVYLPADLSERAVEAIREHAVTGEFGDGEIVVMPIGAHVHIRTGERDAAS